jgi:acetate kinase
MGAILDPGRNARGAGLVSAETSRVAVWVIPTDEERLIARQTLRVVAPSAECRVMFGKTLDRGRAG